jgi:PEP-CTERM motif
MSRSAIKASLLLAGLLFLGAIPRIASGDSFTLDNDPVDSFTLNSNGSFTVVLPPSSPLADGFLADSSTGTTIASLTVEDFAPVGGVSTPQQTDTFTTDVVASDVASASGGGDSDAGVTYTVTVNYGNETVTYPTSGDGGGQGSGGGTGSGGSGSGGGVPAPEPSSLLLLGIGLAGLLTTGRRLRRLA